MEILTHGQATVLLYAFLWLIVLANGGWIVLLVVAQGIKVESIRLGFLAGFKLRGAAPEVRIGFMPMGASVNTTDEPEMLARMNTAGNKLLSAGGQILLASAVALMLVGPDTALRRLESVAIGYFPATCSPLGAGPDTLRFFWEQLRAQPGQALCMAVATIIWLNILTLPFTLLQLHSEKPVGIWANIRQHAIMVPMLLHIPWIVALIYSLF